MHMIDQSNAVPPRRVHLLLHRHLGRNFVHPHVGRDRECRVFGMEDCRMAGVQEWIQRLLGVYWRRRLLVLEVVVVVVGSSFYRVLPALDRLS